MTAAPVARPGATRWGLALAVGALGAVLLLLLARPLLVHPVHYDELLHILSARGLLDGGAPTIADGLYARAQLFTRAVALAFRIAGDDPVSARLPALAGAVLLLLLVGAWVARRAGWLAGLAAALLLAIVPSTVDVAVFARFYTFHAVVVTVMAIAAFEASRPGLAPSSRAGWVALALLLVPLGWHFQETTVIAVGATIAAATMLALYDHRDRAIATVRRHPLAIGLGALALAGIAAVALTQLGLVRVFGSTALWAARDATRFQYYLVEFRRELPLLLPLLPVCAWLGLAAESRRRLVLFALVLVAAALLVHSVAAQKTMRYVYYVVPWMCVLWAVALAEAVDRWPESRLARPLLVVLLAATTVLSVEGVRALNLLAGRVDSLDVRPFGTEPDWSGALPRLAGPAHDAARVITSNSMKALYYLGRYDLELNATIVPETDTQAEFGRDERTGRRVISRPESVSRALSGPGDSLVVLETEKIGRASGVPTDAFDVIRERCLEIALPESTLLRAWRCTPPR